MGTVIIHCVSEMHTNSGNFAPADCMHFTFVYCTKKKRVTLLRWRVLLLWYERVLFCLP